MKKATLVSAIITIALCYAFLYFGNILPDFFERTVSVLMGVAFEVSIVVSTILLILHFKGRSKLALFFVTLACVSFLVHVLLVFTVGYRPEYSYAMDVFITISYIWIIAHEWRELVS